MASTTRRRLMWLVLFLLLAIGVLSAPIMKQRALMHMYRQHVRITADVRAITAELNRYRTAHGDYPSGLEASDALAVAPQDPWHHPYVYRFPGVRSQDSYDLFSMGSDARADTPDDDSGGE